MSKYFIVELPQPARQPLIATPRLVYASKHSPSGDHAVIGIIGYASFLLQLLAPDTLDLAMTIGSQPFWENVVPEWFESTVRVMTIVPHRIINRKFMYSTIQTKYAKYE